MSYWQLSIYTNKAATLSENRMANFFTSVLKAVRLAGKPSAAEATARGQDTMQRGDMVEAVEHFSAAVACDPDNAILVYNRRFAYLEADELELAKADFDLVIEMTPDDPDAYFRRGLCHKKQDNNAGAVKDFTRAIKLHPKNALSSIIAVFVFVNWASWAKPWRTLTRR